MDNSRKNNENFKIYALALTLGTHHLPRPAESSVIYHGDECCKSEGPQCPAF
mgnify:CR=1 FL=1